MRQLAVSVGGVLTIDAPARINGRRQLHRATLSRQGRMHSWTDKTPEGLAVQVAVRIEREIERGWAVPEVA